VVYGSNATDEMSDVFLQVIPVDATQYAVLDEHQRRAELRSKIVGYRKTLELYPTDRWSLEGLASCYVADARPAEAIELLKDQTALVRDSSQAKIVLAMASLAKGDASSAEALLRQAITVEDQPPMAWLGLGRVLVAKENFEEAETSLRRALEISPNLTVARLDLVDLLIRQNRTADAIAMAQTAVEVAPDEHAPLLKQANLYAQQKNYTASLASFAAARKLAPFLYSPESSLAIACYQIGDERTASRLLAEAVAQDGDDPVPRFFLGQIARRNSEWPDARKNLQLAMELQVPRTWPASHVRQFRKLVYTEQLELAQQVQDQEFARRVLKSWSEFEPDNAVVRKMLADFGTRP
jgi:tetratricopeptide (TPR) repeat protein